MAAIGTGERLLGFTIGLVDRSILRTGSPSVMGIDGNNRQASQRRLIGHEPAKLSKGQPVQTVALRPSGLHPLANVRQIFDRNRKAGAFGGSNNLLGKAVGGLSEPPFRSAEFLQTRLGGLAATLQTPATKGEFLADALDVGARIGAPLLGIRHVTDNGDRPLAADQHRIDVAFAVGKQGMRALAADEGNLHPTGERSDAVVGSETEGAIIVGLGGVLAVPDETAVGLLRRVGGAPNSSLSSELLPQLVVDKFLQGILAWRARIETALRNRLAAGISAFERIAERLCLRCRGRQPDVRNGHTVKNEMIGKALQRRSAFLPRLKSVACGAEVL
jgi:hypothetical protein